MKNEYIVRGGTFTGTSTVGNSFTNINTLSLNAVDKMYGAFEVIDYGMNIASVSSVGTPPVIQCFGEPVMTFGTDDVIQNQKMVSGSYNSIARGHVLRFDTFSPPFAYGFNFYCVAFHTVVGAGNSITISGDYWVKLRRLG